MKDDSKNKDLYVKPPSLVQMLKTFTLEVTNYVVNGAPNVTPEDYAERLDACITCEHVQKKHMRCGLCGCMLQMKARMKTATCPDKPSRWKEQILNDKEQKDNNTNPSN
tara:strand:- start:131 stop:457 length:327 start_codon:yes stop_codon:yes gene_type:complete